MNYAKLRAQAWEKLSGNWFWAVALIVLALVLNVVIRLVLYCISHDLGSLGPLIGALIDVSVSFTFLDLVDTNDPDERYFKDVFAVFTTDRILPVFLTWLLSTIFTCLWSLLLIVPGIIKSISYSQSQFIVKDMTDAGFELNPTEAISKSRDLMNGHKMDYFILLLTFIGWYLLCLVTLGIAALWVGPYIQTTKAEFYRKLAGNKFKGHLADEKPVNTQSKASHSGFGN